MRSCSCKLLRQRFKLLQCHRTQFLLLAARVCRIPWSVRISLKLVRGLDLPVPRATMDGTTTKRRRPSMKHSIGAKTLIYPTPTWIVGSYDKQGRPNGMTAAWGGICCSDPPCVAVSLRKATYSYASLLDRKAFTVSVPSQHQVKQADYFGLVSGRDTDKFAATGWTPIRSELVDAPYVQECPLVLECKVSRSSTWACIRSSSARSST